MSMNDNPTNPAGGPDAGRHADAPGQRLPSPDGGAVPPPPMPLDEPFGGAGGNPEPTFDETIAAQRAVPDDVAAPRDARSSGKADTAKDEAREVGEEGAQSAQRVAGTAADEASNVAHEAKDKARNLVEELTTDLREQAGTQQQKVADGLRSLGDELRSMADHGEEGGTASSLVGQAAQRAGSAAEWLDHRDPGSLLDEVKDFARKRPGAFLAVAAGAGLLAGRMTRGLVGAHQDEQGNGPDGSNATPGRTARPGQQTPETRLQSAPPPVPDPVGEPTIDTAGPTIGSGGVGGTGGNPGVANPATTGFDPGER